MKKILSVGLMLLGLAQINAQVATINENFDSFNKIPQNGWTGILPASNDPNNTPPGPLLMVAGSPDKAVQAYFSGNTNSDIILVSPQIVAPTGDSSVSFQAAKSTGSAAAGTIRSLFPFPSILSVFRLKSTLFLCRAASSARRIPV